MKIVYVLEDYAEGGGVERIVSAKAAWLHEHHADEVTLVSIYRDPRPDSYPLPPGIRMIHLDVAMASRRAKGPLRLLSRGRTLLQASIRLNHCLKKLQPDIIFFTNVLSALLLPFCRTSARRVYESHTARPFTPYEQHFGHMEAQADAIVCLTEADAHNYKKASRVVVMPNFIAPTPTQVKDYSTKKAIAVGRLEEVKAFDWLIDSWAIITKNHPDWTLDIYGEGSQHDALHAQIARLGLQGRVVLKGRCDNLMSLYSHYSLHFMCSRYEGFGLALAEAQAAGLPSVSTRFCYGAEDVVNSGTTGLLVAQNDRPAFIASAELLMADNLLRERMGRAARKASARFGQEKIMQQWVALMANLMAIEK